MLEKRFIAVPNQYILADGTTDGIITVPDASLFKVKQEVYIGGNTLPNLNEIEIKRVISPTQIAIGPKKSNIDSRSDLSAYTLAKNSYIAANEQKRPSVPLEESTRAMYEEEPTVAQRTVLVDKYGNKYDENNPLPTTATLSGTVNIGTDGYDTTNPDSLNVTGSEDGTKTGIKHSLRVDSDLDLRVGISDGPNKAAISNTGELSVTDLAAQNILTALYNAITTSTLKVDDDQTQTLLNTINTTLQNLNITVSNEVEVKNDVGNPVPISASSLPLPSGAATEAKQDASNSILTNILSQLAAGISVDDDQTQTILTNILAQLSSGGLEIGTENGTSTGVQHVFVNNLKKMILDAVPRNRNITYLDPSNRKNRRVDKFEYTSSTFPGVTVVRQFNYSLISNEYVLNNDNWYII